MRAPRIVLIGNPNVGKSVIFSLLTERYVEVSNYPGTTVEVSRGSAKINGRAYEVIDTPGINSLVPMSEDERVTRDILLNETYECAVQVADAKNLRRSLLISLQLAEMGVPFILDLNMVDEAKAAGISADSSALSRILGVDVVETVATRRKGIDKIRKSLKHPRCPDYAVRYDAAIESSIAEMEKLLPDAKISKRAIALMLLAGDTSLSPWISKNMDKNASSKIEVIIRALQEKYHEPLGYVLNRQRLTKVDDILGRVSRSEKKPVGTAMSELGNIAMHRFYGLPILAFVLYTMYKFVGEFGAGTGVDFIENVIFGEYVNPAAAGFVNSVIPFDFVREMLVGEYGLITMALTYALAIVLPIIVTFFIFFGILEDSGYLPRLAIMTDRIFRAMGLNGKAVLPMVLGLGCDTMATLTTRILETKKERVIVTLLLALAVPCSAQLGVILGMLSTLSLKAAAIWAGVVLGVLLLVGFLSSKIVSGSTGSFILEIPPMRVPRVTNIAVKTMARLEWYIREAVPLFMIATFTLFILSKLGVMMLMIQAGSPVIVGLLGLPEKATEAFFIGFFRRDYGAAGLFALSKQGLLDPIQMVVSMVTITLFVPCVAQFFVTIKERGLKTALMISGFIFPFAFFVGGVLNFLLRYLEVSL